MVDDTSIQDSESSYEKYDHRKYVAFIGPSLLVTDKVQEYLNRALRKAIDNEDDPKTFIMVGDTPSGTDMYVLEYLWQTVGQESYSLCTAVGEQPRNVGRLTGKPFNAKRRFEDYRARDYNMIDFADVTMIMDYDKTSIRVNEAWEYAVSTKRPAYLVSFYGSKPELKDSLK